MRNMTAEDKAYLISIGSADIDSELLLNNSLKTKATAGPGAGGESFFIRSGERRVRLSINSSSTLKVIKSGDGVAVIEGDKQIAEGMLEFPLCHCPGQAYITVSEHCIYDCKFCPVPKLEGGIKKPETVLKMVEEACEKGDISAISLTGGVFESPEKEVERMALIVKMLREKYDLPIGVSVYPTSDSAKILKNAGADEIKYNVETMDAEIFEKVCPGLSLDFILESLKGAVDIFGRNSVSSNFIIGLGEDDECVKNGVTRLSEMGIIPNLRPISQSPLRIGEIKIERPTAERLIRLSAMTRDILKKNNLDAGLAKTMCLPCTGCDLTPFRDI